MMTREEILKHIRWETSRRNTKGGQHVGIMYHDVTCIFEDLDIEIHIGYHRSQLKNKELAFELMVLAVEECLK